MDPGFLVIQALNGLATASTLFLTASGLSIIFGVTRIVNFAHGSLYMLGAYIGVTLANRLLGWWPSATAFWAAVAGAALAVGLLGALMEVVLLRRVYRAPELFQLLATFGVVLVVQDAVVALWGAQDILGPRAPGLHAAVIILGHRFPAYELAFIAAGPLVLAAIWWLFHGTRFGILIRAATLDREMLGALGVNQRLLFTGAVLLGAALAGLAGALQIARRPATPFMDETIIAEAFVVTVVGGMGSVGGAFLAALLIGELQAFGILVFPKITLVLTFLVMAVVLIARPQGLLGGAGPAPPHAPSPGAPLPSMGPGIAALWLIATLALLALPLVADDYALKLATEILILALFAMSLGLLLGLGGIISFGPAAYFGLGAYGAALAAKSLEMPMGWALALAPLAAAAGAAAVGGFMVRLSGVYLAMLTLAVAEILHAIAFQWDWLTGGDDGLLGIWPAPWAQSRRVFFYLTLALCGAAIFLLRTAAYAPFGLALRAARDHEGRAAASGIDVARLRWLAFVLSGAAAGLAGGLYVFSKGNVDPAVLSITTSVDALVMVLLGGVQTVLGPIFGAAALHLLKDFVMPLTDFWRAALGAIILLLVLAFPHGLAGAFRARAGAP